MKEFIQNKKRVIALALWMTFIIQFFWYWLFGAASKKKEFLFTEAKETISLNWFCWVLAFIGIIVYYLSKKEEPDWIKKTNYFLIPFVITLMISFPLIRLGKPFFWVCFVLSVVIALVRLWVAYRREFLEYHKYLNGPTVDDGIVEHKSKPGDFVLGVAYKKNLNENGVVPDGEDEYVPSEKKAVIPLKDRFVHLLVLGVTGSGKTSQSLLPMFLQDFVSDNFQYQKVNVVQMGQIVLEPKGDFAKTTWAFGKVKEAEKRENYVSFLLNYPELLKQKLIELKQSVKELEEEKNGRSLTDAELKEKKELQKLYQKTNDKQQKVRAKNRLLILQKLEKGGELTKEREEELKLTKTALKKLLFIKKKLPNYVSFELDDLFEYSTYSLFLYASLLSDTVANPSLSDKAWAELIKVDKKAERDVVLLFDPLNPNSPYFNPLRGDEDTAVGTVASTLLSFMSDSSEFFKNTAKTLTQTGIRIIKRVYGDKATLMHLNDLFNNNQERGERIIKQLLQINTTAIKASENKDFASYFLNDYYTGLKQERQASKTYENSSGIRAILTNLLDNKNLRRILCPPEDAPEERLINFDRILLTGDKVAISTATGVAEDLGRMLGLFLMLQLQAAILRRPGKEETRIPAILYVDEFQDYATSDFEAVLTKGRSYVVSATMATQTLGIVEQKAGSGLVNNLQSNARNVIVYPGASTQDADYFVSLFGKTTEKTVKVSNSSAVAVTAGQKLRKELRIKSVDDGERENTSEEYKEKDRFTKEQVLYGPNARNRKSGGNDSFGYVYYRIIVGNSVQFPWVAKIEWIPKELKKASDKLVQGYEAVAEHFTKEDDDDNKNNSLMDLVGTTEKTSYDSKPSELAKKNTIESDPKELSLNKNGETKDLSQNKKLNDSVITASFEKEDALQSLEEYSGDLDDGIPELDDLDDSLLDDLVPDSLESI